MLKRLDGITLNDSNILYCKSENNVITDLILMDATGDAFSYGIITSAPKKSNDRANGSYTCVIDGESYSYSGGIYANISTGSVVKTAIESGRTSLFNALTSRNTSVSEISYSKAVLSDGSSVKLADDVSVYRVSGTSTYSLVPLSEIIGNTGKYKAFTLYSDRPESKGGRVRVIILK